MPDIERESPLGAVTELDVRETLYPINSSSLTVDGKTCELNERSFLGLINVRGNAADSEFGMAVANLLGMPLPTFPNSGSFKDDQQLLWLGPDEWLFKTPSHENAVIAQDLQEALAGTYCAVVDVSSGYTTLTLKGEAAPLLIARGCPLDLHPKVFTTHKVAQSHIAKAPVVLVALEAGVHFEMTVRRSFAKYLRDWLEAAADA